MTLQGRSQEVAKATPNPLWEKLWGKATILLTTFTLYIKLHSELHVRETH